MHRFSEFWHMRLPHRLQGQKVNSQSHGAGAYCGGHLAAQLVVNESYSVVTVNKLLMLSDFFSKCLVAYYSCDCQQMTGVSSRQFNIANVHLSAFLFKFCVEIHFVYKKRANFGKL